MIAGYDEDKKKVTKQIVIGSVAGLAISAMLFVIGYKVGKG